MPTKPTKATKRFKCKEGEWLVVSGLGGEYTVKVCEHREAALWASGWPATREWATTVMFQMTEQALSALTGDKP